MADMSADEAMTRRALDLLGTMRNDAYEALLARRSARSHAFSFWLAWARR
jgi:hypothetical protein